MTPQQIARLYDSLTEDQQNMSREQFIRTVTDRLNPDKIVAEANRIAQGRIQRAQIDAALQRGQR